MRTGPELKLATRRGAADFWMYGNIQIKPRTGEIDQKVYHLILLQDRNYTVCDCPDFEYRRKATNSICKHGDSLLQSWQRG